MEEGYFDYGSKSSYGEPILPLSDYELLIHTGVNAAMGLLDIEFFIYYRIADGFIEFVIESFVEESENGTSEIVGRFKIENKIGKAELLDYFREWMIGGKLYNGLSYNYFSSPLITKGEFTDFNNAIIAQQDSQQISSIEKYKDEPIVEYCLSNNYELIVSVDNENIIETFCPNGSHHISINAESGSWFCGYCRKNGVFEDFVEFAKNSKKHSRDSL